MQATSAGPIARTRYEALLDVRFNVCFHELNERLYGRIDFLFGALGLGAGTAAFAGFVSTRPGMAGMAGVVLAAAAIVERLVRPVHQANAHAEFRRRYGELDAAAAAGLSLEDIDQRLRTLNGAAPSGVRALAVPAYNANLCSHGHEDRVMAMPLLSRLAALLA